MSPITLLAATIAVAALLVLLSVALAGLTARENKPAGLRFEGTYTSRTAKYNGRQ